MSESEKNNYWEPGIEFYRINMKIIMIVQCVVKECNRLKSKIDN